MDASAHVVRWPPTAGAHARSAASALAGCAASFPAIPVSHKPPCWLAAKQRKEVIILTVSISAALMLGAGVFLLCRYAGLKILHAALCIIFGFYLASSSLAPDIANITANLFRLL